MPGTWSLDSSSSCQFRGASANVVAGTAVDIDGAGGGALTAGCAGAGVVATVAGAPHAESASDARRNSEANFICVVCGIPWLPVEEGINEA